MARELSPKMRLERRTTQGRIALAAVILTTLAVILISLGIGRNGELQRSSTPPPVLSVALTSAQVSVLPIRISATGNVVAWQDASVGAEADGLRLTDVKVNVGDRIKRGQVLALFNADIVEAELVEARASVDQAEAQAVEAEANALRAKKLQSSGAMSTQQINQYIVGAMTARARLDVARAIEKKNRLRLAQTRVLAPSDGIISARAATVGAVLAAGQELFRLIKDGRLEWRAEVAITDMQKLASGQSAWISGPSHGLIHGTLRMVAPTISTETRNGLVYVDLPAESELRAGAFARGYFEVGEGSALTLPQGAVLLRDGFGYVMCVGPESKVAVKKVVIGRRIGDRIEIVEGLAAAQPVIASGVGFLSEGDMVNVVSGASLSREEHAVPSSAGLRIGAPARSGP
jgi:RND family efflux transporter MFP subunit